jgi:hypothetical protein
VYSRDSAAGVDLAVAHIVAMVKDHKKDADDFKTEAQQSQNPALQQVAQRASR